MVKTPTVILNAHKSYKCPQQNVKKPTERKKCRYTSSEITQGTVPPQKSEDKQIAGHKDFQRRDSFISFKQKKCRQKKRKAQ